MPEGPLSGLRVVELARILAGPWIGQTLADLGAEVIKVEAPEGDDTRRWGPPFIDRPRAEIRERVIEIEPQQIAVIPRGVRFAVTLPDGQALRAVPLHPPLRWLVLADEMGVADRVADRLRAGGHAVTLLRTGDRVAVLRDGVVRAVCIA